MTSRLNVLVIGYFGYGLVGDEAVLRVIINDIKRLNPNNQVVVASKNGYNDFLNSEIEYINIEDFKQISNKIKDSDLVVVCAAGGYNEHLQIKAYSIASDPIEYNRLCMEAPVIAFTNGVPSMIYGAGIDDLHSQEAEESVRLCFNIATGRALRDTSAFQSLSATGAVLDDVLITCDPAWMLPPRPTKRPRDEQIKALGLDPRRPVIGLTLRHWDETPLRLSSEPQSWEPVVAEALRSFCAKHAAQCLLIASQNEAGYVFADDVAFLEHFRNFLPDIPLATWYRDLEPGAVMATLGLCDFSVAMRHHGAILSAAAGTPTIAIAYSKKVRSALGNAGLEDCVIDLKGITAEGLLALLERVYGAGPFERQRLGAILRERRNRHSETFRLLETVSKRPPILERQIVALSEKYNRAIFSAERSKINRRAHAPLAALLQKQITTDGAWQDAVGLIQELLKAYPEEGLFYFYAGLAGILSGQDIETSMQYLRQAREHGYAREWCSYWEGRGHLLLGEYAEAYACLMQALQTNPHFELACTDAEALVRDGRVEHSSEALPV